MVGPAKMVESGATEADLLSAGQWSLVDARLRWYESTVEGLLYERRYPVAAASTILRVILTDLVRAQADAPDALALQERAAALELELVRGELARTLSPDGARKLADLCVEAMSMISRLREAARRVLPAEGRRARRAGRRKSLLLLSVVIVALVAALVIVFRDPRPIVRSQPIGDAPTLALPGEIHFGHPSARPFLAYGWSETDEEAFVWAVGERSTVHVSFDRAEPMRMTIECAPFVFQDAPEQRIWVLANGSAVREVVLAREGQSYEISLPANVLRAGPNEFEFRYAYARTPMAVVRGSYDVRPLSVRWTRIAFEAERKSAWLSKRSDLVLVEKWEPAIGGFVGE